MIRVLDASVLVAALVDRTPTGAWCESLLADELVGPELVLAETTNLLRRLSMSRQIPPELADAAFDDLLDLGIRTLDFGPFARRIWELQANVTSYDAWYVAIAEAFEAPLATLDLRLAAAPGPRCPFAVPPTVRATGSR